MDPDGDPDVIPCDPLILGRDPDVIPCDPLILGRDPDVIQS